MTFLRWVVAVGVLVLVSNTGCAYKNAQQARTHQTVLATGWSCSTNPVVRCGDSGECSGWEDKWLAFCPATNTAYRCFFDRKYKNDATHVTCDVDGSVAARSQPAKSNAQTSEPEPKVTAAAPLPVGVLSDEGYRESRWGMSPANVQEALPTSTPAGGGLYRLDGPVAGKAATTGFVFNQDRLTQATVIFLDTHVNRNNYLEDYRELKDSLSKKYGSPIADEHVWSQDLYRDDPKDWGMAVSAGHLKLYAVWETAKTTIELLCSGENFKVKVKIRYFSKELDALRREAVEKKNLEGL